jgi:hypothetical protein
MRNVSAIVCILVFGLLARLDAPIPAKQEPPNHNEQSPLSLHISVPAHTFQVGGTVPLRIEVQNVGKEDLWLGFSTETVLGMPANFSVIVRHMPSRRTVAPEGYVLRESPYGRGAQEWWVRLQSTYFYGRDIQLTRYESAFVDKPGKYQILVQYEGLSLSSAAIPKKSGTPLPRPPDTSTVFTGKIESNPIEVEIVPVTN